MIPMSLDKSRSRKVALRLTEHRSRGAGFGRIGHPARPGRSQRASAVSVTIPALAPAGGAFNPYPGVDRRAQKGAPCRPPSPDSRPPVHGTAGKCPELPTKSSIPHVNYTSRPRFQAARRAQRATGRLRRDRPPVPLEPRSRASRPGGCVLICGNLERCIEILLTERIGPRSAPQVTPFLRAYFKRGSNYDCDQICQLCTDLTLAGAELSMRTSR
jgi:hypothetical protein